MIYIKPSCKSFAERDVVGVAQTQYASIHLFFEQVSKLDNKPTQAVVQMAQSNTTETIYNTKDLA